LNISVQKLLGKMEEELKQAKTSTSEERVREKIYAVKALCELVLDEQSGTKLEPLTPPAQIQTQTQTQTQTQIVNSIGQPPKMKIDEESNGDSLFDF
jgi:hypothetical protein